MTNSYYTRRKKVRSLRKIKKSKNKEKNKHTRKIVRRNKRGSGKTIRSYLSKANRREPYVTAKTKIPNSSATLASILSRCASYNEKLRNLLENQKRRTCKFDKSCYRQNLEHRISFKHSGENLGQIEIDAYRECADKFLGKSWQLYKRNDDQLPNEWYIAIATYLPTSDYTDQHNLYFNILANICQNGRFYVEKYSKRFIQNLLVGMEESAVTGMFDITNRPELMECLAQMNSSDDRYLSNTALLALTKNTDEKLG